MMDAVDRELPVRAAALRQPHGGVRNLTLEVAVSGFPDL
jgi:hypothetical protein